LIDAIRFYSGAFKIFKLEVHFRKDLDCNHIGFKIGSWFICIFSNNLWKITQNTKRVIVFMNMDIAPYFLNTPPSSYKLIFLLVKIIRGHKFKIPVPKSKLKVIRFFFAKRMVRISNSLTDKRVLTPSIHLFKFNLLKLP
jgi:hypothetical protein